MGGWQNKVNIFLHGAGSGGSGGKWEKATGDKERYALGTRRMGFDIHTVEMKTGTRLTAATVPGTKRIQLGLRESTAARSYICGYAHCLVAFVARGLTWWLLAFASAV